MNRSFRLSACSLGFAALIVLGLGASPSLAVNWVEVGKTTSSDTCYYDADSLRTDKGLLYVWLKMTLPRPEYKDFLKGYGASQLLYYAVDCSSRTAAVVEFNVYDQQGSLLDSLSLSNWTYQAAPPGSIFSAVIERVCSPGASPPPTPTPPTPPLAANWIKIETKETGTTHYDADSLRTDKGLLYVWTKTTFAEPRQLGKGSAFFTTLFTYDAMDCSSNTFAVLAAFSRTVQGVLLPSRSVPGTTPVPMEPGSTAKALADAVCGLDTRREEASRGKGGQTEAENASSVGSGFIVSSDGLVLTNAHVVPSCRAIHVTTASGERRTASLAATDPQSDLALLRTKGGFSSVAAFRVGRTVRLGEDVIALGYPLHGLLASGVNVSSGTVSALAGIANDSTKLQISAPVQPGNSGGPLLDLSGALVGIVVAKLDAIKMAAAIGDIPQNVNFAIKADVARLFLEGQGVSLHVAQASAPRKKEDVAAMGRDFTVLVECLNGPDAK